ncbi:SPRY domain-containing protein [Phytophthora infestans]|uniref:SPRY domain-containing protein n=1 Tax=Phytophthora infestans TaxID=4787 RepID=A0A8S9UPZ2_PHYIN|nr:SPRY domain-containing protein [Phytophthora infestans]
MLAFLSSSLPSPTVAAKSSRPQHLNSFVVLTKKSSSRRLSRRRYSIASSCSTASNSSDDESDGSDLEPEDCCVLYESYAAVTKRNSQPASIRWSDLQRAQNASEVADLLAALRLKRRHTRDGKALELTALELCFEFLTVDELQNAAQVCTAFHEVVKASEMLLTGQYSRQWRAKMLPETYVKLAYRDQLVLCTARRSDANYELSTRSAITHLPDGKYRVVNNSMLRKFDKGAVDSIRGVQKLPVLSCARALQRNILYYEVSLKGCGSVGLASVSDAATRNAFGFGSGEHVGWKGVSYAYHGNDGDFVFNDGAKPYGGEWGAFGPSWGRTTALSDNQKDDTPTFTVGCGLDADKHQIFFTLNGEMVGTAPTAVLPGDYAAAVSLHAFGDEAMINAGASPFLFDIEGFCASP